MEFDNISTKDSLHVRDATPPSSEDTQRSSPLTQCGCPAPQVLHGNEYIYIFISSLPSFILCQRYFSLLLSLGLGCLLFVLNDLGGFGWDCLRLHKLLLFRLFGHFWFLSMLGCNLLLHYLGFLLLLFFEGTISELRKKEGKLKNKEE